MKRSAAIVLALLAAACSTPPSDDGDAALQRRPVDRPGQKHTPSTNAAGQTMTYFGGPVIPNPKVYVVWWGNPANLNPAVTAARGGIADFYAGITNSSYMDWLNEYNTTINAQAGSHLGVAGTGQRIGRGNYAGTLTLSSVPAGNVTDAQIQAAIDQAFSAGTLPLPDENTIYAVYFPASVSISMGGSTSCVAFGAYHEAILETARHNAYYLAMPDCGDSFSGVTSVSSHELIEAVTDGQPTPGSNPDYPQAWNDSSGSEVGDLCQSSSGPVTTAFGTFNVQGIWDERSQGCKVLTNDAQDFSVSLTANTTSLASGAAGTFTIQSATTAGAVQALALTVSAPAGVTATISPAAITSGQTATLTVTASGAARSGLQVVVRADGAHTHTASLLLAVSGGGGAGNDFSLAAAPASLSIAQGGRATSAIATAVVSGSPGTVSLAAAVSPAGPTVSLSPASVNAGAGSTLSVAAGSGVAPGSYSVTVTGTAGAVSHAVTVALTVTGAGGGGLINGGFESGLTGWTGSGAAANVATAHGGASAAQVGSSSPSTDSALAQTFTAPAGASGLSFWYQVHCPDTVTYDWATATLKDNTTGTTATMLARTCSNTGAWQQATASVTPGHGYTLTLANHDDNYAGDATYTWYDGVAFNAPAASDFSIAVSPATLAIAQGAAGKANLTTAVTAGSAESVAFGASGLPAGVTAAFSPASVQSGGSATVTLTAAANATPGTAAITLTGTAASGAHSATLSLTVTASSSGGGVNNGGFESGLAGWAASGTTSAVGSGCHGGAGCARLGSASPTSGDSSLAQTFTVPAGKTRLSAWYKLSCPDTVTYDWATATLKNNATGATATILAKTCSNSGAWASFSAAVTAGASYTLTLVSHDDNYASDATSTLYDDVTLN